MELTTAMTHALHELMLTGDSADLLVQELTYLAARIFSTGVRVECGVTYQAANTSALTVASSSAAVVLMDEAQYEIQDGPCLTALRTGETTAVHDTATESRWPHFFNVVQHLRFRSVLGVALWIGEHGAATLNLYRNEPGFFDSSVQEAAKDFARQSGSTLEMMLRSQNAHQHPQNLRAAMASRTIIDLAVGMIMGQNRCSQGKAFEILKDASNHQNLKVRVVAERLIGSVTPRITHHSLRSEISLEEGQ